MSSDIWSKITFTAPLDVTVKLNFQSYIRQYTSPNENFEISLSPNFMVILLGNTQRKKKALSKNISEYYHEIRRAHTTDQPTAKLLCQVFNKISHYVIFGAKHRNMKCCYFCFAFLLFFFTYKCEIKESIVP